MPTRPPPPLGGTFNAEAAKYRRRLRDTEAERDQMAAKLEAVTCQLVELVAATHLPVPKLLWRIGATPAGFTTDHGTVDTSKVLEVAKATAEEFGIAAPQRGCTDLDRHNATR